MAEPITETHPSDAQKPEENPEKQPGYGFRTTATATPHSAGKEPPAGELPDESEENLSKPPGHPPSQLITPDMRARPLREKLSDPLKDPRPLTGAPIPPIAPQAPIGAAGGTDPVTGQPVTQTPVTKQPTLQSQQNPNP
jgi:hypothetical protein